MISRDLVSDDARHGRSIEPEVRLCRQIILKAVLDAIYGGSLAGDNDARIRAEAFNWFGEAGQDFKLICECAEFDPRSVRRDALRYIVTQRQVVAPRSRRPRLNLSASTARKAA